MQVTETVRDGLKRELKVLVAGAELSRMLDAKLSDMQGKVRLKGFRPGKVPTSHMRKYYGRSAMAEVVEQAVNETAAAAIRDRDERPASQPSYTLSQDESTVNRVMEGESDLEYTVAFEVLPTVELTELKTLKVERETAEVSDTEIERGLAQLAKSGIAYEAKDAPAEMGDRVTMDFVGRLDGEPFEGGSAEGANLVLGSGGFIPGFEAGLVGIAAGETRMLDLTFPDPYGAKHLAGKPVQFEVTATEIAASRLPAIDDDFAKTVGMDNVAALRDAVREQMETEFRGASREKAKRALLDALDAAHSFELPATLVDAEFNDIWRGYEKAREKQGKAADDQDGVAEARAEYRALAERRVRLGLVLSEIGTRNRIQVGDEEVKRAIIERARAYPGQERQVVEFYRKNPQAAMELRAPIFEDKVVDFALELVDVTERVVPAEELFRMPPEHGPVAAGNPAHGEPGHVHGPGCGHDHDH